MYKKMVTAGFLLIAFYGLNASEQSRHVKRSAYFVNEHGQYIFTRMSYYDNKGCPLNPSTEPNWRERVCITFIDHKGETKMYSVPGEDGFTCCTPTPPEDNLDSTKECDTAILGLHGARFRDLSSSDLSPEEISSMPGVTGKMLSNPEGPHVMYFIKRELSDCRKLKENDK